MALKPWDQYVADASRDPLELPLPDGTSITIGMPTGAQVRQIAEAHQRMDNDGMMLALFGPENGKRIIQLADDAPAGALLEFVRDVMDEFKLNINNPGEFSASSS